MFAENGLGILENRLRVFFIPIQSELKIFEKITVASCVLHSYLREKILLQYSPPGTFDCENIEKEAVRMGNGATTSIVYFQFVKR